MRNRPNDDCALCSGIVIFALHIVLLATGITYGKINGAPRDEDVQRARDDADAWCYNNFTGLTSPATLCPALFNAMTIYVNIDNCGVVCQNVRIHTLEVLCTSGCKSAWSRVIEVADKTVDYHHRLAITGTFYFSAAVVGLWWIFFCVVMMSIWLFNNPNVQVSPAQVELAAPAIEGGP